MKPSSEKGFTLGFAVAASLVVILMIALVFFGLLGLASVKRGYNRSQKLKDANNQVKVTTIYVRRQQQEARRVAARDATVQALADQRVIEAHGIRDAQDIINATLTPLYVQHEAVRAQLAMAHSPNHTIIYVPSGTNGTPVITQDGKP